MTRSFQSFGADDEAANTLRQLDYTEEQIGRTLPAEGDTENRLRTSLRALSSEHSETVQREHSLSLPKPKYAPKAELPPTSEDYERGRRDEAALHDRRNAPQPGKVRAARQPVQKTALEKRIKQANQLRRLAGLASGKRRR